MSILHASQLKAARALIGWSQDKLAKESGVSSPTVKRMENSEGAVRGHADSVWKVQQCLESAGVELIPEDEKGFGARLRKPKK
jgi:transcriptional regulator with XRE-family HTH domain